jgi:tetratricopeptide (TPR) repeat protein
VALATLGQIFVQLGDLERAEQVLTRTLEVRSTVQFHETTGAVFDTLAQIHLMRGSYERAEEYLRLASEAYGAYGTQTMRWYEWSLKVLGVKLATRRHAYDEALNMADALAQAPGVPQSDAIQADLAACEALMGTGRLREAEERLEACEGRLDPRRAPANWGEFLRIRGLIREQSPRPQTAHHDFAQSANIFQLLGERYQAALSHLALARLSAASGSSALADRYLEQAGAEFTQLGAQRDLEEVRSVRERLTNAPSRTSVLSPSDADEGIVRRLVDAAIFKELLARETAAALLEVTEGAAVSVFTESAGGDVRVVAAAGCDNNAAMSLAHAARQGHSEHQGRPLLVEPLGTDQDGPRRCAVSLTDRLGEATAARLRMFTAISRQGFDLCGAREAARASARTAVARVHLCGSGYESPGRSDPAPAGPQPDGADHW